MILKIPKVFSVEFLLLFMKYIPTVNKKIRFGAIIFIFHQNAKENWQTSPNQAISIIMDMDKVKNLL